MKKESWIMIDMTKIHRKILFTIIVGITIQLIWPIFTTNINNPVFFTLLVNISFIPIIILQIFEAKLNTLSTFLVTLCSIFLSPLFWMYIGFELEIELLYITLFDLYSPLGITASLLLCQVMEKLCKISPNNKNNPYDFKCNFCSSNMQKTQIFCNNCHKISPNIKSTLNQFPTKKYLDFSEGISKHHRLCPHCANIVGLKSVSLFDIHLGVPLKFCSNCQNIYLTNILCEWFLLSLSKKIYICLLDGLHIIFYILFFSQAILQNISFKLCLVVCLAVTLLRIIWFFTVTWFDIRESENRLKVNPDYPHLLNDMGYQHFKQKCSSFNNHK